MAVFTSVAGTTLLMDRFNQGGTPYAILSVNQDGSVAITVRDLAQPGQPVVYSFASTGSLLALPFGSGMYPVHSSGFGFAVGDLTLNMVFNDAAQGVVGTLAGLVWHDVRLLEYPVYEGGNPDPVDYTYELSFDDPGWYGMFDDDDTVTLGDGDDVFAHYAGPLVASLGAGDDVANLYEPGQFSTAAKFVDAGDGDDRVYYQSGNGTILGGAGNDAIGGNGNNDGTWLMNGGAGRDTIEAYNNSRIEDDKGSGNDTYVTNWYGTPAFEGTVLSYASGKKGVTVDLFAGVVTGNGHGTDLVTLIRNVEGTSGADVMTGVALNNGTGGFAGIRFWGLNGADTLTGGEADDVLDGGKDGDLLDGRGGNDILSGGAGNDTVTGGTGGDVLNGGSGTDVFVYHDTGESTVSKGGRDVIRGFDLSDQIDLSLIDARTDTAAHEAFVFIGQSAFTYRGQIRYEHVGGNTVVYVHNSGGTNPEMRIDIAGIFDLTEAHFGLGGVFPA